VKWNATVYAAVQERMLFFRYQKGVKVKVLQVGQDPFMKDYFNYGAIQNL